MFCPLEFPIHMHCKRTSAEGPSRQNRVRKRSQRHPNLQAGERSMIIQKPEGRFLMTMQTLLCFVTHLCSQKYLTGGSAKRDSDSISTTRVINTLFMWEIAPLVHSEKFDMKRTEIEVCVQQLPNGYSSMIPHSLYARADQLE
jgi:hypothetical protein